MSPIYNFHPKVPSTPSIVPATGGAVGSPAWTGKKRFSRGFQYCADDFMKVLKMGKVVWRSVLQYVVGKLGIACSVTVADNYQSACSCLSWRAVGACEQLVIAGARLKPLEHADVFRKMQLR